ncbi:pectin acetylesterase 5-like isoform X1 [Elysia marginata]|uniref:Pectin acetylesterase 5-like isoform X1 n=1 Tax=Elysia marginata TaxID=1093978 RepID=A0AAV4JY30_9GAST|nr:pectin acetylesterase 5-like isoform X1 [Elysia marginata]
MKPCSSEPVVSISGSSSGLDTTVPKSTSDIAFTFKAKPTADSMAFVPVRISRPQLLPPVLCSRRFYVYLLLLVLIVAILCVVRLVSQIKVTFVHMHLESDGDLERVTLPKSFSEPRGARCLDGSPPAYYFRPSKSLTLHTMESG